MLKKISDGVSNKISQLKSLNQGILSGCMDIIVIQYPDGQRKCSPFYVIFGMFKVFKSMKSIVKIYINDEETQLVMALGKKGEAFFVTTEDEEQKEEKNLEEFQPYYSSKKFKKKVLRPSQKLLLELKLNPGENIIKYQFKYQENVETVIGKIFL